MSFDMISSDLRSKITVLASKETDWVRFARRQWKKQTFLLWECRNCSSHVWNIRPQGKILFLSWYTSICSPPVLQNHRCLKSPETCSYPLRTLWASITNTSTSILVTVKLIVILSNINTSIPKWRMYTAIENRELTQWGKQLHNEWGRHSKVKVHIVWNITDWFENVASLKWAGLI